MPAGVYDITLDDASINSSGIGPAIHIYSGAAVNLTLEGVNTLQSGSPYGGIDAAAGTTLVITGQSTGKLTANGGAGGAGIGGGMGSDSGTITINGGGDRRKRRG